MPLVTSVNPKMIRNTFLRYMGAFLIHLNPGKCNPLAIHATVKKKKPFVSKAFGNRHEAAIDEKSIHLCSSGLFCINHPEHLFSLLGCCSSIGWNYYTLIESEQKDIMRQAPGPLPQIKGNSWMEGVWSASMPLLPASMALQWVMYSLGCCTAVLWLGDTKSESLWSFYRLRMRY